MFATLTLRRSVPVSLSAWGAIGGFTLGGFAVGLALQSATRVPNAPRKRADEQIAFDRLVVATAAIPIDASLETPVDAMTSHGVTAILHSRGSVISLLDARSGKAVATYGTPSEAPRASLAVTAADSGRWMILDSKRGSIDLLARTGDRLRTIMLPRGFWSNITWDAKRRHVIVTGVELDGPKTASDGRSIHEFDERGIEVGAHREIAPIEYRLQGSFNMPFAAIHGSEILSGSSLSNEVLRFDRSSATERVIRVADDWFQPINWVLPRQTTPAKTLAEPTLKWLASQTMLTAIIPVAHGQFIARFTRHSPDRERYVYALVDSAGRTRTITQPTTIKLSNASSDTLFGLDLTFDGRVRLFSGVILSAGR